MSPHRSITVFHLDDGARVVVTAEWEQGRDIDLSLRFSCERPLEDRDWPECMRHISDWATAHVDLAHERSA